MGSWWERKGMKPDFIGLGAQKAGTSWIYGCLYEHAQLCLPVKEIHFFSRDRHYAKGIEWYEEYFSSCSPDLLKGELSTSYLYSPDAAKRIYEYRPGVKLIACLRNPITRAFSNYQNDIMAGQVSPNIPFERAVEKHPEYLEQGFYSQQLSHYFKRFDQGQLLLLIYEDSRKDALKFIQTIFHFLDVDPHFVPGMFERQVNVAHVPRSVALERLMHWTSGTLRKKRLSSLVWRIKLLGLQDWIYRLNTKPATSAVKPLSLEQRQNLFEYFRKDIDQLEAFLGRELKEWRL